MNFLSIFSPYLERKDFDGSRHCLLLLLFSLYIFFHSQTSEIEQFLPFSFHSFSIPPYFPLNKHSVREKRKKTKRVARASLAITQAKPKNELLVNKFILLLFLNFSPLINFLFKQFNLRFIG
ncbi:uncharacterized protein DS421_20g685880 [Arachis hypogaea]|nr:uncharacterized protein DS421_20g685880 [Arachis hypogaea]